jgi:hypothetical protein
LSTERRTIVIGDGWAAVAAAGFLAGAGRSVTWIAGTGSRLIAPLPSLESGPGVAVWKSLADRLEVPCGEPVSGSYVREFRNKAFREPAWQQAPTPEARRETRDELLWAPEARFAGAFEARFDLPLDELAQAVRERVLALPGITRIEGLPVKKIETGQVTLGSGETHAAELILYADRWSALPGVDGLPRPLPFLRGRDPVGALQATFTHAVPVGAGLAEGFVSAMHKEAGEELARSVLGGFSTDGGRSHWTLFLAADESEDNHEIAKKLRRLKQTLDRTFTGEAWVPADRKEFTANVTGEQVRFEELVVFTGGEAPSEAIRLPKLAGVAFITDGYGPSRALDPIPALLAEEGIQLELPDWQPDEEQSSPTSAGA